MGVAKVLNHYAALTHTEDSDRDELLTQAHADHEKGLTAYAFSKVHNRALCSDLVQDTFIKTWSYLVKGGKVDVMKAFLYHILNNLIIDEYRKHKVPSLDILLAKGFEPGVDETERLFNALDGKAAIILIQYLPEKYRKVMRMRYVQDLSLAEMSLISGETKNSLAVQLHRGTAKLKELYTSNKRT